MQRASLCIEDDQESHSASPQPIRINHLSLFKFACSYSDLNDKALVAYLAFSFFSEFGSASLQLHQPHLFEGTFDVHTTHYMLDFFIVNFENQDRISS